MKQSSVPLVQFVVARLAGSAGQEDRWPDAAAVELPLVPQGRAGQRRYGHRGGPLELCRQPPCHPWFVVVLEESNQPRLVAEVSVEVIAHAGNVTRAEPVVEPLVVTPVQSLVEQVPFQVSVGLGQ